MIRREKIIKTFSATLVVNATQNDLPDFTARPIYGLVLHTTLSRSFPTLIFREKLVFRIYMQLKFINRKHCVVELAPIKCHV